jgi:hypothetical protein
MMSLERDAGERCYLDVCCVSKELVKDSPELDGYRGDIQSAAGCQIDRDVLK